MSTENYTDAMSTGNDHLSLSARQRGLCRLALIVCLGCALSWLLVWFGITPLAALILIPCYGVVSLSRFKKQERREREAAAAAAGS